MVVMLVGLLWNHWSFLVLFSIIHFGCWWEYLGLTEKIHKTTIHNYSKIGWMLIGFGLMLLFCGEMYRFGNYGLRMNFSLPVSVAGFVMLVIGIFQKENTRISAFGMAAFGLIYISLSWGLMMDMREIGYNYEGTKRIQDLGYTIPIGIIASIWINDTMAYIVGSLVGRTPLSSISPKKTWEGTIGGIILAILIIGIFYTQLAEKYMFPMIEQKHWFIIAGIAAVSGTLGDLFESKLKRMAGVKDSGSLMPGHGGFLDRFDSLLIATPFVWLYVRLFVLA